MNAPSYKLNPNLYSLVILPNAKREVFSVNCTPTFYGHLPVVEGFATTLAGASAGTKIFCNRHAKEEEKKNQNRFILNTYSKETDFLFGYQKF